MLTSRATADTRQTIAPLATQPDPSQPAAGTGTDSKPVAADASLDCSALDSLLADDIPGVRIYSTTDQKLEGASGGDWIKAPTVAAIIRCGGQYLIQVRSNSVKPWVLERARLEGPNGEEFKVIGVRPRIRADGWTLNVISVEMAAGRRPGYLRRLQLVGIDASVAVVELLGMALP